MLFRSVDYGRIHCPPGWERSRCLVHIAVSLRDILRRHKAEVCAIESLFYAQNFQTAIIMGEARGAAMAAIGEAGLEIYEVAPRKMKQAIVGYGAAQKSAVSRMVQRMLGLDAPPQSDASDALALALTYLQEGSRYSLAPPRRV